MRLTEYVHLCLETRLKNGDSVLDATAGNGYDTLKAAELVQPNGNVVAIDIQKQAIEATEAKLTEAKLSHLCELHLGNHGERLSEINQSFDCILFNLGYLPRKRQNDHHYRKRYAFCTKPKPKTFERKRSFVCHCLSPT